MKRAGGKETGSPVACCNPPDKLDSCGKSEDAKKPEESNKNVDNLVIENSTKQDGAPKKSSTSYLPEDRPVQKNKKRCWDCQAKLELAQRELGKCRCGKKMQVFKAGNTLCITLFIYLASSKVTSDFILIKKMSVK